MRIWWMSDIHFPFQQDGDLEGVLQQAAQAEGFPDAFCLLGDVHDGHYEEFDECLRVISAHLPGDVQKAVVAGNHDLYRQTTMAFSSDHLFRHVLPNRAKKFGWEWMDTDGRYLLLRDRQSGTDSRCALVASMAWYDYSATNSSVPYPPQWYAVNKRKYVRDGVDIDADWNDIDFARTRQEHLCSALRECHASPLVGRVFLGTHVPILEEQMVREPGDEDWNITNAYFGNLTTGHAVRAFPKVCSIISGHGHVGTRGVRQRDGMSDVYTAVLPRLRSHAEGPGLSLLSLSCANDGTGPLNCAWYGTAAEVFPTVSEQIVV